MDIFKEMLENMKKHSKLIYSGKTNEEALRGAWGDEEAEKVLSDLKQIENQNQLNLWI